MHLLRNSTQISNFILCFLLLTPLCTFAQQDSGSNQSVLAAPTEAKTQSELANINRHNMEVGGTFGAGYSSYSGGTFNLNPTIEYFVSTHFSIGGTVNFSNSDLFYTLGVGPSASYYFWQNQKWAAKVGLGLSYMTSESDDSSESALRTSVSGRGKLGINYFINPAVSFGPEYTYAKTLDRNYKGLGDTVGYSTLLFQLSVFL